MSSNGRYKGKSYRATVEIVKTADRVTEFCRQTCIKLECCPNLFGPRMVLDKCSENCSVLTKTKYSESSFSNLFTIAADHTLYPGKFLFCNHNHILQKYADYFCEGPDNKCLWQWVMWSLFHILFCFVLFSLFKKYFKKSKTILSLRAIPKQVMGQILPTFIYNIYIN